MISKQMRLTEPNTTMGVRALSQAALTILFPGILMLPHSTRAQSAPSVGEGVCVEYCGSSSSTSSSSSSRPTSWAETPEGRLFQWMKQNRQESQHRKAHELNEKGVGEYNQGRYADAAKLFEKALAHEPNDATIRRNMQNATQAFREAQAAAFHAANAASASSREDANVKARNVFDTRASAAPASPVDARGSKQLPTWPAWINKDHKMVEFRKEREKWLQKEGKLEAQLAQIREQDSTGQGNKSKLQVQEAQVKDKLSNASYNERVVENEMESYAITLSGQAGSAKQNR
jgi:hypothetical protein